MGKNKLKKFAELEGMGCVYQYPFRTLSPGAPCPMRGKWHSEVFKNDNPIVLELGCGKGEYTVGLAREFPDKNFIGIDIKGARMYTGAKTVEQQGLRNAAFLRTSIELLDRFFAPGEVAEIWITFADPQMKKRNKRLTGTRFQEMYRRILPEQGGVLHLKSDSPFLTTYTHDVIKLNNLPLLARIADVHNTELAEEHRHLDSILTHYERQWIDRGLSIKYLSWMLQPGEALIEPESDPEPDTYRSYARGTLQMNIVPSEN